MDDAHGEKINDYLNAAEKVPQRGVLELIGAIFGPDVIVIDETRTPTTQPPYQISEVD